MRGDNYLLHFALPNYYFHLTTAYDILRYAGVEIGKRDFLGAVPGIDARSESQARERQNSMSIQRIGVGPRMSQAVVHGDTVYLPARSPTRRAGKSVGEQTAEILGDHRQAARRGGLRQDAAAVDDDLSRRHQDLRRDERGLGGLGRAGPHAGPRDRRGQARRAAIHRRDRLHRRQSVVNAASDGGRPSGEPRDRSFVKAKSPSARGRSAGAATIATPSASLREALDRFLRDGVAADAGRARAVPLSAAAGLLPHRGRAARQSARLRQILRARRLFDDGDAARGFPRLSARAARAAGRRNIGAEIEVGLGAQEIAYPYVFESGDELGRGGVTRGRDRAAFSRRPRSRWSATRSPTACSKSGPAPSGRWRCSTPRASIIRCAGSCTTPARTGARCSPGCC